MQTWQRRLARVLWVLYLVFLALCAVVVAFDPPRGGPANGSVAGAVGLLASAAAGMPWTFAGMFLIELSATAGDLLFGMGEPGVTLLCWAGAALNLVLLRRAFRRAAAPPGQDAADRSERQSGRA